MRPSRPALKRLPLVSSSRKPAAHGCICGQVHAERLEKAYLAGRDDYLFFQEPRSASDWPLGTYGHGDYWLGYTEAEFAG